MTIKRLVLVFIMLVYLTATWVASIWYQQVPAPFQPPIEMLKAKRGDPVTINVPDVQRAYEVEVYSTIEGQKAGLVVQTPQMIVYRGYSELRTVTVPPLLVPGTYTVVVHLGYFMNPLRLVNQSALVAVLTIE